MAGRPGVLGVNLERHYLTIDVMGSNLRMSQMTQLSRAPIIA